MSYVAQSSWYANHGGDTVGIATPTFTGYDPNLGHDPALTSAAIRQAFAFFRRHGDRRYSAQSLMRLLAFADRLDAGDFTEQARIVTCEVPFSYDEDTEVKSGGVLGVAVSLPDGRVMLAVHQERRRGRVGTALLAFVRDYYNAAPIVWVHRQNMVGAAFLCSQEYMPWVINTEGAVQYCAGQPQAEESDAVAYEDDNRVDQLLANQARRSRRELVSRAWPDHEGPTEAVAIPGWCADNPGSWIFESGRLEGRSIAAVWSVDSRYVIWARDHFDGQSAETTRAVIRHFLNSLPVEAESTNA